MRLVSAFVVAVALCALVLSVTPSARQAQPITQSVRAMWNAAKKNIVESADLMPEENYAFKPVDGVRTFGEILAHVAGANYVFCAAAKGEKPPHSEDEFEKTATSRQAIVKAVADSMAYCDAVIAAQDDASLAVPVDLPYGFPKSPRAVALLIDLGHLNEHYGNLVTYFRIKGIVPPSSRR